MRALSLSSACLLGLALFAQAAGAEITLTDITERRVTLPAPAQRIVLGDARHIIELAMLDDDPAARLVGWRADKGLDPARLAAFSAAFPAISDIATVGAGNRQLSVEQTIALDPDLVVLSLVDAEDPQMDVPLSQLEAAGIAVIFVDFFSHPIENTPRSLDILAKAIGAEARAAEINAYYTAHLNVVRDRLADHMPEAPSVFVQVHATPDSCCATVGAGVFHDFITAAGGHNLGEDIVPGLMGTVGLENLIALDPDVFLATGGAHLRARGGLVLGAGVSETEAADSFAALLATPGIAELSAVESASATGIWHLFNDSPLHVALIEHLAQRFHPALFADLTPEATMAQMQARFLPVSVPGVWWIDAQ
ncbi:corrinoid ABC transporter substrate-binding protein [Aquimixticola soesokkakensis]|uniref:Corrinoid ABC transporter substrate-binding protein n=1 Tax=Aquimixticola soesokkakensis TaxID=1519096 RepID=A0A1Y5T6M7_9RHOB|nr:ABC transporter substrate-binding protein [Aquimixticola soesokkakensis]SLN56760.1 corrinoid ABC transporter substrate-binding protein [Aquimixticola soesokkakensis]